MKRLDIDIESSLPSPLYDSYMAFLNEDETQPFRQVHRLIDLIEVFCKLYTTGSIATFLDVLYHKLDNKEEHYLEKESFLKIQVMLAAGLRTPSLGIWWQFARVITQILKNLQIPLILPDSESEILGSNSKIRKAFDGENNLITFRNSYAHGATFSDTHCRNDLDTTWPKMLELITKAHSMQQVKYIICTQTGDFFEARGGELIPIKTELDPQPGHSWFCANGNYVDTYPILSFRIRDNKADFFFYNDLKEKYANFLNYPYAEHLRDSNLKTILLEYIKIEEWKKIKNNGIELEPFRQQIEVLIEVFRGRKLELEKIASFINQAESGFLCIWGPPGVGKSALLARSTDLLKYSYETWENSNEKEHIWREKKIYTVEYFIRRGSTDTASHFFDSINQRLDSLFNLNIDLGRSETEKQILFNNRLQLISKNLKDEEKLLLIIDGLDEIKTGDSLLSLLPRQAPSKVLVIFGARPQQTLRFTFYEQLHREQRNQFNLRGLSLNDIRAVLMDHVNKYELQQKYVEDVLDVSQGNPLYLKLLCLGLEENLYQLNHTSMLPKGMDELYQAALLRLENNYPGIINLLIYFAAAKDFVSPELMATWMGVDTPYLRNHLLYAALEFLYQKSDAGVGEEFQLFHESLREYLSNSYPSELATCRERICDWSVNWKRENGDILFSGKSLNYAMQFSTEHIFESYLAHKAHNRLGSATQRRNQLFALTENESWRAINFETCGNGDAIGRSYLYLQKILSKEDSKGEKFHDFLSYAINRYADPEKMYKNQRDILTRPVKKERLPALLERTNSLAKMGQKDDDKIVLSLFPLWANNPDGVEIPDALRDKVAEMVENSRDTAIKKLWDITINKRWHKK